MLPPLFTTGSARDAYIRGTHPPIPPYDYVPELLRTYIEKKQHRPRFQRRPWPHRRHSAIAVASPGAALPSFLSLFLTLLFFFFGSKCVGNSGPLGKFPIHNHKRHRKRSLKGDKTSREFCLMCGKMSRSGRILWKYN